MRFCSLSHYAFRATDVKSDSVLCFVMPKPYGVYHSAKPATPTSESLPPILHLLTSSLQLVKATHFLFGSCYSICQKPVGLCCCGAEDASSPCDSKTSLIGVTDP